MYKSIYKMIVLAVIDRTMNGYGESSCPGHSKVTHAQGSESEDP